MFHYVYIITNNINNKRYIGKHSYKRLDNHYRGSGNQILAAIKKYGKESFTKEIVAVFDSEDEAYQEEHRLISEHNAVESPLYYNITVGGKGARAGRVLSEEHKQSISTSNKGRSWTWSESSKEAIRGRESWHKGRVKSEETRQKMSSGRKGMKFSEAHKAKIREARLTKHIPYQWINDGYGNKRIGKDEIIPDGYVKGKV